MKLKKIAIARVKNALGLVVAARDAIKEEPLRADMRIFGRNQSPKFGGPACGIVGCFGGWIANKAGYALKRHLGDTQDLAENLLGEGILYDIVGSQNHHVFNNGAGDECEETQPGTRAHANAVVKRINRFIAVNRTALKNNKVKLVKRDRHFVLVPVPADLEG